MKLGYAKLRYALAAGLAAALAGGTAGAESMPSSKAGVSTNDLSGFTSASWAHAPQLDVDIKVPEQKDLVFDLSLECGVTTFTKVKSKGGNKDTTSALAGVRVAIELLRNGVHYGWADPNPPANSGGIAVTHPNDADNGATAGVTYCRRLQELSGTFAGLNCTANEEGVVTCTDPEEVSLLLETLGAHAFNFTYRDLDSGVYSVRVWASIDCQTEVDGEVSGACTDGVIVEPDDVEAVGWLGFGSLIVDEIRLIKDAF